MSLARCDSSGLGRSRAAFDASDRPAFKWTSYFPTYDEVFAHLVGKPITFVEVGVLHGGSLRMWRTFLGPEARIIGVDIDPKAKRFEEDGIEIVIGDQADPTFWRDFYGTVGPVDALLDDGGHTFEQQIITTEFALANVVDGGVVVVEDTLTSFDAGFLGPSRASFAQYVQGVIEQMHARFAPRGLRSSVERDVISIEAYASMFVFHVDRVACSTRPAAVWNAAPIGTPSTARRGWAYLAASQLLRHAPIAVQRAVRGPARRLAAIATTARLHVRNRHARTSFDLRSRNDLRVAPEATRSRAFQRVVKRKQG